MVMKVWLLKHGAGGLYVLTELNCKKLELNIAGASSSILSQEDQHRSQQQRD